VYGAMMLHVCMMHEGCVRCTMQRSHLTCDRERAQPICVTLQMHLPQLSGV
jgi:hypothetical protein